MGPKAKITKTKGKAKDSSDSDSDNDDFISVESDKSDFDDDFESEDDSDTNLKKRKTSNNTTNKKDSNLSKGKVEKTSSSSSSSNAPVSTKKMVDDGDDGDDDENDNENKNIPQKTVLVNSAASSSSTSIMTSSSSSSLTTTTKPAISKPMTNLNLPGDITQGAEIATEGEARKVILKYFIHQNRPYSALQVYENLHKRAAKSVVEKALTNLCEKSGGLLCKEYGKVKIYYVDQNTLPKECDGDMDRLEDQIEDLKAKVDVTNENEHALRSLLSQLETEPVDSELDKVIEATKERLKSKDERIRVIKEQNIDPNTMATLIRKHNNLRSMWKARKDICKEFIDQMSEGMNKKVKDLIVDIGIETDEANGVKIPDNLPELKRLKTTK